LVNRSKHGRRQFFTGGFYFVGVFLLLLCNVVAWLTNLLLLPGNWAILAITATFVVFTPEDAPRSIQWSTIGIMLGFAVLGEILEMFAGAAGAAKQGASKRSLLLSLVGAIVGSTIGIVAGTPLPIFGSIVGALVGASFGAFAGAYLGEKWKRRDNNQAISVGMAALVGRLLGTMGKIAVGAVMVALALFDSLT